jgi:hypothetical protein
MALPTFFFGVEVCWRNDSRLLGGEGLGASCAPGGIDLEALAEVGVWKMRLGNWESVLYVDPAEDD